MLFSILIPTLEERRAQFARLEQELRAQIERAKMEAQVELVVWCDNREHSVGAKRNALLERARGEYVAFVDDDDAVHQNYVALITRALREHPDVDCLGIQGLVYFRGAHPKRFVYSAQYDHYFSRGGVYYRPPYILNPMRRAHAQAFKFPHVNYSEDAAWAMQLARARILKREVLLPEILYHYLSRRRWYVQAMIDATEPVRHPLGLQMVNRLRVKSGLRDLVRSKRAAPTSRE